MSDRLLEKRINIKFCVKLGNIVSRICVLYSEAYGRDATKKSSVLSGTNGSKSARMSKSQMKTMLITLFNIFKGIICFELIP
jgi:hypothetical protein